MRAATAGFPSQTNMADLWSVLGGVCLFNALYYSGAFLFFWVYVFKVERGLGLAATAQRFAAVMASVWAGSQVRAGCWSMAQGCFSGSV